MAGLTTENASPQRQIEEIRRMVNNLHCEVRGLRDLLHSILWKLDSLQDSGKCHEGNLDGDSDGAPEDITAWSTDGAQEELPVNWEGSILSSSRSAVSVSCNALHVEGMKPPDVLNYEQNTQSMADEQSRPGVLLADDEDVRSSKTTISENSQEGHQKQPAFAPTDGSSDRQQDESTTGGLTENKEDRNKRQRPGTHS